MVIVRTFATSGHCTVKLHCPLCRDLLAGRAWRVSLSLRFAVPGGAVDFVCPHGRSWGTQPSRGLGDTVAKVIHAVTGIKPCGGCRKRQAALNRLMPYET